MNPSLRPILDLIVDGTTKGFPQDHSPVRLGDIGEKGWNLLQGDLSLPAAILRKSVLDRNSQWMREFLRRTGTSLCPHGKTTMAPQLFHRQLEDGAWGITLATPHQARIAHAYGVKRILLANELASPSDIAWVRDTLDTDPAFQFLCLVDSVEGAERLQAQGRRPIQVLVELGIPGGRTGARSVEEALAVARRVKAAPSLALAGVECYEGIIGSDQPAEDERRIVAWLDALGEVARGCQKEGLFETDEVVLTAGGSAFFDLVAARLAAVDLGRPTRTVLRSGCYLSHDAGHYKHLVALLEDRLPEAWRPPSHLEPALEIWGQVVSRPEEGLAFLNLGKRDVAMDLGMPMPARWFRPGLHRTPHPAPGAWRIPKLYDQHARLEVPAGADLAVGDLVACAISHPCTTFDKWQVVYLVDDAFNVVEAVRTFF